MTTLVSHVRTAKYVMAIVLAFLITWAPVIILTLYETILQLTGNDPTQKETTASTTFIYACLKQSLQDQECNMKVDGDPSQVAIVIRKFFHFEFINALGFLSANFWSHFNSLLNPLLYAFWYPDFRNFVVQIPELLMSSKDESDNSDEKKISDIFRVQ